jgi:hypothetical protein
MALSKGASFVVGCGIALVVLLTVGVFVVIRGKKIEDEKRRQTIETLEDWAKLVRPCKPPPRSDGAGSDWTGQTRVKVAYLEALGFDKAAPDAFRRWPQVPRDDAWGNPIRYRCPGPVHTKGWDLWSCGPNGKDDQGEFDDILVGEDLAPVGSR